MNGHISDQTIALVARTVFREASRYGFERADHIRLLNAVMDLCIHENVSRSVVHRRPDSDLANCDSDAHRRYPIQGPHIQIREFKSEEDGAILQRWIGQIDSREFLSSRTSLQSTSLACLASDARNHIAMVTLHNGTPIGSLAYLAHDLQHKRAELRKLIGEPMARGKGYAREATQLWLKYGFWVLDLEKIYISTTITNLRNIKLNQDLGFMVEGLLRNEIRSDGSRHDVLRMGMCRPDTQSVL